MWSILGRISTEKIFNYIAKLAFNYIPMYIYVLLCTIIRRKKIICILKNIFIESISYLHSTEVTFGW